MAGTRSHQLPLQDASSSHSAPAIHCGERQHQTLHPAPQQEPQIPTSTLLFYNRYTPLEAFQHATTSPQNLEIARLHLPSAADDIQADNLACYTWNHNKSPTLPKASNGLLPFIEINATSALAIHLVQVLPGDTVLDRHAAGGDEAIAAAQSIWPYLQPSSLTPPLAGAKKGALHISPSDNTTRRELEHHVRDSLPASLAATGELRVLAPPGNSTGSAAKLPLGPGGYDKVLLRFPTLAKEETKEPAHQPASTSPELSAHQLQNLLRALHAVRIGGKVLYTTSSVAREDNDAIVESAISWAEKAKQHDATAWTAEVEGFGTEVEEQLEVGWAERTGKGWIVLPEHGSGRRLGPFYFCVLTKRRD